MKTPSVKKLVPVPVLALLWGAGVGAAQAATLDTKGGFKVKSDDGEFEASLGGRIQFDLYELNEDENAIATAPDGRSAAFGSGTGANDERSSTYFRRLYLTLKGKAYGWSYKFEPDFAGNSTNNGVATGSSNSSRDIAFQDIYISHALGPGDVFIGQMKPFRGMEELTSSNDITLMERPFASAAGTYGGGSSREFQEGIFYKADIRDFLVGASFFDLRRDNTRPTEGIGYNGRVVYAPLHADGKVLHLGLSYSDENPQTNGNDGSDDNIGSAAAYAGRRGPTVVLGTTKDGDHARTLGVEVASEFGAAEVQAEYMLQTVGQGDGARDQDIPAWYVQASYFLTGESRPYKKGEGVFGQPKPASSSHGAVELALRYDHAENKDSNAGCDVAIPASTGANPLPATTVAATHCEASLITAGVNWYVNPAVRFMFDYLKGENDRGFAKDKPQAFTARAQFAF
ncbi:OprO/OprP family phosphate-selective porin [Hydrocarboniphaga effusa]|uniref:OprO/OprP family phosphate-selective porin n=1 Tax=Hydrocarboniphaga effusa TaxID=243629 RepID=UPI00313824AF